MYWKRAEKRERVVAGERREIEAEEGGDTTSEKKL